MHTQLPSSILSLLKLHFGDVEIVTPLQNHPTANPFPPKKNLNVRKHYFYKNMCDIDFLIQAPTKRAAKFTLLKFWEEASETENGVNNEILRLSINNIDYIDHEEAERIYRKKKSIFLDWNQYRFN